MQIEHIDYHVIFRDIKTLLASQKPVLVETDSHGLTKEKIESGDTVSDKVSLLIPDEAEKWLQLKSRVPWCDIFILAVAIINVVVFSLIKGGKGSPSLVGLACGRYK